jgi:hypothetical protein
MSLNALEIVQEAAKRLNIMVPTTIVLPKNPDTSTIDYDANLLTSCLNATIKQNAAINMFNMEVQQDVNILINPKGTFGDMPDIVIDMTAIYPEFESLLGDSITLVAYDSSEAVSGKYVFREISTYDFTLLQKFTNFALFNTQSNKPMPSSINKEEEHIKNPLQENIDKNKNIKKEKNKIEIENEFNILGLGKRDFPSQNATDVDNSTNKGSGFRFIKIKFNLYLWICNNIITNDEIKSNTMIMNMLYYSKWLVADFTGTLPFYKDMVTLDGDNINLSDELLILGTLINYKGATGLDYSLELGQQKALIDGLKISQENIQYVRNNPKRYVIPQQQQG